MVLDSVQFVHSSFADNYNKKQKYLSTYIISDDPNKQLQQTEIAQSSPLRWYHWSQISDLSPSLSALGISCGRECSALCGRNYNAPLLWSTELQSIALPKYLLKM